MSKKYEITQEAIEAAAAKCPTAKDVLKTMFPEAFEGELVTGTHYWVSGHSFQVILGNNGHEEWWLVIADHVNNKNSHFSLFFCCDPEPKTEEEMAAFIKEQHLEKVED